MSRYDGGAVTLPFWKYQGLGNDFVVVEASALMSAAEAMRLCDRRRGIGADGVLSILPPRGAAAAYMHIYNSDGSVAAMCGNGIRCVARHLAERRAAEGTIRVETDAGIKTCVVHRGPGGEVEAVSVEMGPARYQGEEAFELGGVRLEGHRVSMGNPHAVFFGEAPRERAIALGPRVERAVPGGVNAGFAFVTAGGLDLVVWERGAGLTDACGTGACAAAVAAVKKGMLPAGAPIEVRLPGGVLQVTVAQDLERVTMRGPAERVFEGRTSA
jgi:diaminopimelate epimerase